MKIQKSGGLFIGTEIIVAVTIVVVVFFTALIGVLSHYHKRPSNKVLVICGKVGSSTSGQVRSARYIHDGTAFIIPIIQAYQYVDLTPISINIGLKNALSKQNIRVDVSSCFIVSISTESGIVQNMAGRLLGLKLVKIQELAKDTIFSQLYLIIAAMDIEEISTDRDKFLLAVSNNVEIKLKKIGLRLINVSVTDIDDESGYIDTLGKEAATEAINNTKRNVAEKNRDSEIGHANALKDQHIQVAAANATAVRGEDDTKTEVVQSDANRREKETGALRQAMAAEKVQAAMTLQEAYGTQQRAEQQCAELARASQRVDIVVKAEIDKRQRKIAAEAKTEVARRKTRGEADAIYARMEAQARGVEEVPTKQVVGMQQLVSATDSDPSMAVRFIITDKLEQLVRLQADAIKNIKIDKVIIWDSVGGENGSSTTANFLSDMLKSIPPVNELFRQTGMTLLNSLSTDSTPADEAAPATPEERQEEMTAAPS